MNDLPGLLQLLVKANVEFILVGGVAATAHGSARLTVDLDVVYRRTPDNLDRLVTALTQVHPYLRGAPPGLPFQWDCETVKQGLNFILMTSLGALDLLGEITGGGGYDNLILHTIDLSLFGVHCKCLDLPTLIQVKRAAGRPKDLEAIAELTALQEEIDPGTS